MSMSNTLAIHLPLIEDGRILAQKILKY